MGGKQVLSLKLSKCFTVLLALTVMTGFGCGGSSSSGGGTDAEDAKLKFDSTGAVTLNVTVDGNAVVVTKYAVTYVANPIAIATNNGTAVTDAYAFQKMNIYVPATAANDQKTAIILAVNNSGWMASAVGASIVNGGTYVSNTDTDKVGKALANGYVFCDVGTRGRGLQAVDGTYPGKAPACVVDAKAAIRYLRLNDVLIPGSSERIVITGTSGGGGLSTAIAASGNSSDYYPYLKAIGAAGIDAAGNSTLKDDVFAVIAYTPITDFGHADIAYEWQYSDIRVVGDSLKGPAGFVPWYTSTLTNEMMDASIALKSQYSAYVVSLGLVLDDGTTKLTGANLQDTIKALVKASVEKALASGQTVPAYGGTWTINGTTYTNNWLTYSGNTVSSIDYTEYLEFVKATAPLKGAPSFDVTGTMSNTSTGSGESNLFGSVNVDYSNFTEWAWNNNNVAGDGSGADDTGLTWDQYLPGSEIEKQLKMINPIAYLRAAKEGDSAPYWYVRYGLRDRDTSFAVETTLFYSIKNDSTVKNANYSFAYLKGHAGDYDVQEAYTWLATELAANPL